MQSILEVLTEKQREIIVDCSIDLNECDDHTDNVYRRHAARLSIPVEIMRVLVRAVATDRKLHAALEKLASLEPVVIDRNETEGTPLFDE